MNRIANLPDWAESHFATLCDEAGVVRNKSAQDRTGWDYIVEFERARVPGLAHDRQPGAASARVQIKSKGGRSPRTELKLTNALRFCREPSPCFIVLALQSPNGAMRLFAREFDRDLMVLTLRRSREADRDGLTELHKIRIPVSFSQADEHGNDLIAWLRERTVVDSWKYASDKEELNRTLGFEKSRMVGSLTFKASETQALIEHSVGIRPSFEVERVELHEQRFEIPAREPIFAGRPDSFSLQVAPRKASLSFKGANGREARFPGEFRSMNLPGLDDSHHRATFTSPHVNGTISGMGPFHLTYNFSGSERETLPQLHNRVSFSLACRTPVRPTLYVETAGPLDMGEVIIPGEDDPWMEWFDQVLEVLAKVPRRSEHPKVSLDDLGHNADSVDLFVASLRNGDVTVEVMLKAEPPELAQARDLLYHASLPLGGSTFSIVAKRPCLAQEREGMAIRFRFGHPVILEHAARRGEFLRNAEKTRRHFDKILGSMGRGAATLADGDWMKLGGGTGGGDFALSAD